MPPDPDFTYARAAAPLLAMSSGQASVNMFLTLCTNPRVFRQEHGVSLLVGRDTLSVPPYARRTTVYATPRMEADKRR